MALDIKINKEVLNTGDTLILTDITGVYTENNEGGYGTPNPNRVDYAMLLYAIKRPHGKDPVVISNTIAFTDYSDSYTNTSQSKFNLPYKGDGWYQFYFILVPITYAEPSTNDIKYNVSTGGLEIYKSGEWEEFDLFFEDNIDLLISEDYNWGFTEEIIQLDLITQKNCALMDYIDCSQCSNCKCDKYFEEHEKIRIYIQAIDYMFYSNKKYEAVKTLEKANKEFKCCK